MNVVIGEQRIELIPREVKAAKEIVAALFQKTKEESVDKNVPSLYFTTIIIAYVMANDLIKAFTPQAIATILNAAYNSYQAENKEQPEA